MIPLQALALIYAGMLLENPARREQLTKLLNGAGAEVEKVVKNFSEKAGEQKYESPEQSEPTEFR